MTSQNVSRP